MTKQDQESGQANAQRRLLYGAPHEIGGAVVLVLYAQTIELWVITHTETTPLDLLALKAHIPAAAEYVTRTEVPEFAVHDRDFAAVDYYVLNEAA
ncbi:hypothetical protein [Yinghuangia sp. YIM S09857]|uniref:hypothetical protein n=1 Tax=Yinghuangia sp. YIM S09857 TaxID=3436929 RepID=UPI003F52A809